MTMEELDFHYFDGWDIIQPRDFVHILLLTIGTIILIQIVNGIMNILTARHFKKMAKLEQQAREDEARLMAEQWESVITKFSDIIEMNIDMNEKLDFLIENIEFPEPPEVIIPKKRGKYKPRKPKVLEHQKTPSE
jgi:hypothetical protein